MGFRDPRREYLLRSGALVAGGAASSSFRICSDESGIRLDQDGLRPSYATRQQGTTSRMTAEL